MENPFEVRQDRPKRPALLTVLCILTFIGSGWNVLSNLFSIFTSGMMTDSLHVEQYSEQAGELESEGLPSFMSGFMESSVRVLQATAEHAREIAVLGLVLGLVSLSGAILMFQLRRSGFYFYTAAQILSLFILPYFAGFSMLVVLGMLWGGLMTAIFVILYAFTLKYMR